MLFGAAVGFFIERLISGLFMRRVTNLASVSIYFIKIRKLLVVMNL